MATANLRPTPFSRPHWFVAGLLLLFVILSFKYSLKVLDHRSAFVRWQDQVLEMWDGKDISQQYIYPNPPIMALLLSPLAHLPPLAGALTWFSCSRSASPPDWIRNCGAGTWVVTCGCSTSPRPGTEGCT